MKETAPTNQVEESNEGLRRELRVIDIAVNTVNSIIGGGIYLLPAVIAISLGNASILAYLLCGLILLTVMMCFAEASGRVSSSGGAYVYIETAFGPLAGFLANFIFIFGFGLPCDAAIANGMLDMLAIPFPIFATAFYRSLFFVIMFGFFAFINVIGVKQGMKMVKAITFIKMIPLTLIIIISLFNIKTSNFTWEGMPAAESLGAASLILFFAFQGGETAVNLSGEMKNPRRTGPLGILLGIVFVVLFYIIVQLISQGVLGAELKNHEAAPMAAVASALVGPVGGIILIAAAIFSIFGTLSGSPLTYPRMIFAGGRDGLLPKFLSKIHPRYATPYWSVIAYALLSCIVSSSGGFRQLAIISSSSMLIIYVGVVLSVIKFRFTSTKESYTGFRMPGHITIPLIALVTIIWFLSHLKNEEVVGISVFAGILVIIYIIRSIINRFS